MRSFRLEVLVPVLICLCAFPVFAALAEEAAPALPHAGRRILWVDSYHQGFEWSDGIAQGIAEVLEGTGVEFRAMHMDTKRHDSLEFGEQAGLQALAVLKEFQPDLLIASDDNAQKYLVVPQVLSTDLPVVFCGVNWDASMYGYPCPTVTGMIEVNLVREVLEHMRRSAGGERVGYLSGNVETERKILGVYNERFFDCRLTGYLASTFEEFKRMFLAAQQEQDMLLIGNYSGIEGWDADEAKRFVLENGRIPSGCFDTYMADYAVFIMSKSAEEQGRWAAQTALRILGGESPGDIPVAENREVRLMVNMGLARAMNIHVPLSVLRTATIHPVVDEE